MSLRIRKTGIFFLVCLLIGAVVMVVAPARSYSESINLFPLLPSATITVAGKAVPDETAPRTAATDSCLPLLQITQKSAPGPATATVQPQAGQAAAISLLFGVRYALGPVESGRAAAPAQNIAVHTDGQHAAAIAQYRRCRNEQSLGQGLATL